MSTFALPSIPSLEDTTQQLPVPASIRALAFLSQLAVYKDLIPGYRIRQLTEAEDAEKVRDEVRRLREGEKMLVRSYKGYLKMLEGEIKRELYFPYIADGRPYTPDERIPEVYVRAFILHHAFQFQ
jgi:nucleolar complex protein 3